jgi:hypothetical protein
MELTNNFLRATDKIGLEPSYLFCIEGIEGCFSGVTVEKIIRWGDEDLFFGNDWVYGGLRPLENQKEFISLEGSSRRISQQLYPDKGSVSSVSSITIRLIDKNNEVSKIISPGVELTEILGARAELSVGFKGTAFPDDYIKIFAGLISDIISGAGYIDLTVNHPDEKKRSRLFEKVETQLVGDINNSTTTIELESTIGLILPTDAIRSFVRIDDEFIEYTGISGNNLTGVVRGALVATNPIALASAHDNEADVFSFYILEDNAIDLALKLMLSGSGEFIDNVPISNFVLTENNVQVANSVYFYGKDLNRDYGLVPGDFITITGATESANNGAAIEILSIESTIDGSFAVIDQTLVFEVDSPAVCSFRSKYDVLTEGLGMDPRDVDIKQHEFIRQTFAPGVPLRFFLKDTIENGKDFIEQQIYVVFAGYSLPRGTRSSLGLHIAPLPFAEIEVLNKSNIVNPSRLKLRRSYARNFYNSIVFRYDEDLYEDRFLRGTINFDAQSRTETKRRKDLVVTSKGLRSDLQAQSIAQTASARLLDRYRRGSEFFEQVELLFGTGIRLEVGDAVIVDFDDLEVTYTQDGSRDKPTKLFEITNKDVDLAGRITVQLTDTSFDGSARYGLFSPASFIGSGTPTLINILPSFSKPFGDNEWRKWDKFIGATVKIRSQDFSVEGETTLVSIAGNQITLSPALSFTPQEGYLLEFSDYDTQSNESIKLIYTHLSDDDNDFTDGQPPYVYL